VGSLRFPATPAVGQFLLQLKEIRAETMVMRTVDQRRLDTNDDGFGLVELLIVIVVLGILATVIVFAVRGITDRGENARCEEDERIMQTAIEAYFAQTGSVVIPISNPAVSGVTGLTPEGTLLEFGLLGEPSQLHDVAANGSVAPAAASSC